MKGKRDAETRRAVRQLIASPDRAPRQNHGLRNLRDDHQLLALFDSARYPKAKAVHAEVFEQGSGSQTVFAPARFEQDGGKRSGDARFGAVLGFARRWR
jgi:hypothetical protein